MAKQATRLSDFQIPRSDEVAAEAGVPAGEAVTPVRIAPRPPAEARQAMTVRLPVSMHERVRMLVFASRRSQQDIVEQALDALLRNNGI